MQKIILAGIQTSWNGSLKENLQKCESWMLQAIRQGADLICPGELFAGPYFCKEQDERFFDHAYPIECHPVLQYFIPLAQKWKKHLAISFFEKDITAFYNSVTMINDQGAVMQVYRKSHIPDGPGYQEKYYFRPGNTGFRVYKTALGAIGVAICWDQWFPECARSLVLQGAQCIIYPTAIGSEPKNPSFSTAAMWRAAMAGHAVCNSVPIMAVNRIGLEEGQSFYGQSFIVDPFANILADAKDNDGLVMAEVNLTSGDANRHSFGFFRDRRPDAYTYLMDK